MEPLQVDSRILSLAAEVTESPDQDVPVLLLKIKGILTSVPPGSKESQKIKQDLYYYDLVQYCLSVLKQDYTRVLGGWATAVHIAEILSLCCVGLEVKEEPEEFYNKLLPSAVDNLLFLGRRLQVRCIRAIKVFELDGLTLCRGRCVVFYQLCIEIGEGMHMGDDHEDAFHQDEDRREFLHCFRTVTDAICWLSAGHSHLADNVLQNEHFLQLLMADDVETSSGMMSVLQNILRINRGVLLQVAEKTLHCILDELVYKLSSTVNPVIGSAVVKLLLSVAESDSQLVTTLTTRYKGLETLLSKQWAGRGFDTNLDQLLDLLRLENNKTDKTQRLHHAVCIIQAAWRGFQTRKRLKQLPKAVTTLQKNFRAKREQELQQLRKQKEEESLLQQLQLQRQRAMRRFHERQLTLLEIVHAGQVDKHMREMEDKSAVTIQRHWRAFRARKKFLQQKQSLKQYRAAVIIQKAVLKFLEKQRKRKAYSLWKPPKALSDEQKLSLQEKVKDYIKLHSASEMSEEMSRELHQQAQEKLAHYVMKRSLDRKTQQHREALLAQIHTYVDQLMVCNSVYLCDTPLKMPNTDAGEMLGTRSIRPRPHSLENPQQPVESGRESLRQYIESAPSLAEATTEDLNVYMSRSVPVVAKAKQCHYSMLKYSQWPWWKKLGEEFLDDEGVSEDLLCAEVGTLFIGGTKS